MLALTSMFYFIVDYNFILFLFCVILDVGWSDLRSSRISSERDHDFIEYQH